MKRWRVVGIDFSHMHMGDNLRMAFDHPDVDVVGICDARPDKMDSDPRSDRMNSDPRPDRKDPGDPDLKFCYSVCDTDGSGIWTKCVAVVQAD